MSWQITENNETLTFTKFFPQHQAFLKIELDPSQTVPFFSGEIVGQNNEVLGSDANTSFLKTVDSLLNLAYNKKDVEV